MEKLKFNFAVCGFLLSTLAVGQHVVTVSMGTCLPGLGSMSFISTGGPGPSTLPAGAGVMPNKSESITPTSSASTPSPTPGGFLVAFNAPGNSPLLRRDVQMFPTLDGQSTTACIHSPLFNVDSDGQLVVVNAGTSMTYSTTGFAISAPFAPSGNVGDVSTAWQLDGGTLSWKNGLFYNGTASLCSDPDGVVRAYFLAPTPADCTPIVLSQASVYTCPGYFEANPNGQLAPFTPSSNIPVVIGQSTESPSVSVLPGQSTAPPGPVSLSESIASSFIAPSFFGNGSSSPTLPASSLPTPFLSNSSTATTPSLAPTLAVNSSSSASTTSIPTSSLLGTSDSTSTPPSTSAASTASFSSSTVISSTVGISSSSSLSSSSIPTTSVAPSSSSSAISTSPVSTTSVAPSSSSSAISTSPVSTTSVAPSPSSSTISPPSSTFIQVTITSTISSGSSLYTTFLNSASQTVVEEIVQPTPFTTTIYSGSSIYTTSTILPDGQEEVEIVDPATTTTTSYTATTTITTITTTGANGQVTETVVQPTPGMQYFGFQDPQDGATPGNKPDASRFNNEPPASIDIQGVFPADINFYTADDGTYTFPGQTLSTNAATYAMALEGYLYGPAGDYSITLSTENDDYGFIWTDAQAYSGWTDDNCAVVESIGGGYTQNHTFTLVEGGFLPVTILWVNVGGAGGLRFWIYPPTGGEVQDTTGYFVQPYAGDSFVYHTSGTIIPRFKS